MRRIYELLYMLVFIVAGASTLGACTGRNGVAPEHGYKVGEAVEGTYAVFARSTLIGHLSLNSGQYTFTAQKDVVIPDEASGRFFFIKHPEGHFEIEYYGSVDQDVALEDLPDGETLLFISFGIDTDDAHDAASMRYAALDRVFLIKSDKKERTLYFHSIANELQLWDVSRPWGKG